MDGLRCKRFVSKWAPVADARVGSAPEVFGDFLEMVIADGGRSGGEL